MNQRILATVIISGILILSFLLSCNKEDTQSPGIGKIVGASDCKNTKSTVNDTVLGCAEYSYNNTSGTLLIKHINAIFNCCPGDITCDVSIKNDTISVMETSSEASCHCSCFYDLDIEIAGIEEKEYYIRFIEPYIGSQQPLEFDVNFYVQSAGTECVERDPYP